MGLDASISTMAPAASRAAGEHRCPVIDAYMAMEAVSGSRISPTMMTAVRRLGG
jgi:hypothetical protein